MGASDAGFEHSAAPHGILCAADVMDFQRFGESAHATDLNVDDSASAGFDGEGSAARVDDRLVQA